MFRPDYFSSYPPPGLKLLLTSLAPKIQTSSERSYRKCWNSPRVKAIVSLWSFLSLQGKKRSRITIQNNTYCSWIQVFFIRYRVKVSIILKTIKWNYQLTEQNWLACELGTMLLFNRGVSILKFAFGPEKFPGLSRNRPMIRYKS